ncbi:hypothetical protein [Dyella lutea]|uniref:Uncharacterized protein n=1 Tax=Dyella lutea TaxID=2950441 RepID=A0ABT1F8Z8_9GAMM|nr:hypothetical protein [Dyella lutea]MCP1373595.1 hypothetical protein [Dyella lutea]
MPDPHRWTPPPGLAPLDDDTRALLQRLRRRPWPRGRRRRLFAWAAVALLHGFFALVLWQVMQPPPAAPFDGGEVATDASVLQVRFIPRASQPAPPPPPPPALQAPRRAPQVHEAPRHDAMQVEPTGAAPAPATSVAPRLPSLFDRDGVARLPAASASASAPVPEYIQRKPTGDMQVMQHTSPVPYRSTRFEQYFPPPGENAAQAGLRKLVGALQGKGPSSKTVNLPRGVHLKCKTLLGVPTPFCGLPPAPPPPNDGDERLNMPPPPLAKDPHAPAPPSLATCIAAYRAQGPLPYGCPVDTPARAVDEEVRDCVARYRAGKRLPTWCPTDTAQRAKGPPGRGGNGTPP